MTAVSVVTPCFEDGRYLRDAVESVETNAPESCELIIVDDGSRDTETIEVLRFMEERGHRVIRQPHSGQSKARNTGIAVARCPYILTLDADNRIRPGFVEEAARILDLSPGIGVVYSDRKDFGCRSRTVRAPEFDLALLLVSNYIDMCSVFRKEVWLACGGFDEHLSGHEDMEFWIHAAALGWRFHHLPRVFFEYRVRSDSVTATSHGDGSSKEHFEYIAAKHVLLYREVLSGIITDREELRRGAIRNRARRLLETAKQWLFPREE